MEAGFFTGLIQGLLVIPTFVLSLFTNISFHFADSGFSYYAGFFIGISGLALATREGKRR